VIRLGDGSFGVAVNIADTIRLRSASSSPKPMRRRGSPSISTECSPAISRAAGSANRHH